MMLSFRWHNPFKGNVVWGILTKMLNCVKRVYAPSKDGDSGEMITMPHLPVPHNLSSSKNKKKERKIT
jgi:hypothetical protein